MKKILSVLKIIFYIILVLIPAVITTLSFFKIDSVNFNEKIGNNIYKNPFIQIFGIVFILSLISVFIFLIIKNLLRTRGVKNEPIKFKLFLKKFNPFVHLYFSKYLHSFQHDICQSINDIYSKNSTTPWNEDGLVRTKHLLNRCQDILKIITGVDFSIHVKLFEHSYPENSIDQGDSSIKQAILSTYKRFPSREELNKITETANFPARNDEEKFSIYPWKNKTEEDLYTAINNIITNETATKFKKNFAYDYVLGPTKHYWLSNNLSKDHESKTFISSSENWQKYYNSLGVFVISSPIEQGKNINYDNKAIGLLIIDSFESNVFSESNIKEIMGYFAHRFYDYFSSYQKVYDKQIIKNELELKNKQINDLKNPIPSNKRKVKSYER